jgi:hypothetical protein
MPDPISAIAGGSVVSGLLGQRAASTTAGATERAAAQSADVQREALAQQREMFERQIGLQEPWRQAGTNALAQMQAERAGMPPAFTGQVDLTQDPGYAFRLSEGMKALERSAAARGNLLSGGTLKGIQRYGQDLASQEYQNAYNRALTQYNAATQREATGYNRLAALAGVGQTAAGQQASALTGMGGAIGQTAANLGNLYMGAGQAAGQARASGYLGLGNTLTGALGTGLNYLQAQQLMNRFPAQQPGTYYIEQGQG